MASELENHRHWLADDVRIDAFSRAIAESVAEGSTVLDLGCGTGVWSLVACRAGAKRVYAVDQSDGMLAIAKAVIAHNGCADRVRFLSGWSTAIELPEPVDVVVADQMGSFGIDAGIGSYFRDAARRHLAPAGRLIPSRLRFWCAPVEWDQLASQLATWSERPAGVDLSPLDELATSTPRYQQLQATQLLAAGCPFAELTLGHDTSHAVAGEASFEVRRAGRMDAVAGWFDAALTDEIRITNAPDAVPRIQREQIVLPLERPVVVSEGDSVHVALQLRDDADIVVWNTRIEGSTSVQFTQSTLGGMLLSKEQLRRNHPKRVPKLTREGRALVALLGLVDGHRSLREIREALEQLASEEGFAHPSLREQIAHVMSTLTK